MARLPRYILAGQPQHVIQRGNNRQAIFGADGDYRFYLEKLQMAAEKHGCAIHAYVLMTNHVHLLLTPQQEDGIGNCSGRGLRRKRWMKYARPPTRRGRWGTTGLSVSLGNGSSAALPPRPGAEIISRMHFANRLESIGRVEDRLSPALPHQTVHAICPHTAFRCSSHRGMHSLPSYIFQRDSGGRTCVPDSPNTSPGRCTSWPRHTASSVRVSSTG